MATTSNSRILRTIPFLILIYLFSFPEKAGFFGGAGETNVQAATINVPADLPTIQDGINAASNGDTVLVWPGTYVENINFNGKNIVVGSLVVTTGDNSYIHQTVIDGNQNGSVVTFESGEDSTAVLSGFTITNGSGTWFPDQFLGGGIFLDNSSPDLLNLMVTGNVAESANGAGICCINNSNCRIENVIVTGNDGLGSAPTNDGTGGIAISNSSSPTLRNVVIANNTGLLAGGMFCVQDSNPVLTNVTIAGNQAFGSVNNSETAEFISWQNSNPVLINTIIWNDSLPEIVVRDNAVTISYSDVQGGLKGIITYDNATVNWLDGNIDSEPMFVDPVNVDYRLKAGSPCIDAGDNSVIPLSRLGGTDLDGNPRIINGIVDMGAYEAAPIPSVYYVDAVNGDDNNDGLTPETAFATIQNGIDAAADGEVVLVYPGLYQEEINFLGKTLIVQGIAASGAGVPVLQNPGDFAVSFYYGEGPDSILKNFIIRDSFMAVFIAGSSPTISNLTIVDNKYGIEAYTGSEPDISNTILWNNTDGDLFGCEARYSCIERGGEGEGEGNITVDPLFVAPDSVDYHLYSERGRYWLEHDIWVLDKVTSPCVDGGDPTTDTLNEPMPHGSLINIGA